MNHEIERRLLNLACDITIRLDRIHDEELAKFRHLAKSTGQRTRGDRVKKFSLEPDDHMKWIYDPQHPDYNSKHAEYLRKRRAHAISIAPQWMFYR